MSGGKTDAALAFMQKAMPDMFGGRHGPLPRDGRVLAAAMQAKGFGIASVLSGLDMHSFISRQELSDILPDEWLVQILRGQEAPTGPLTMALCRMMGMAPHDLLTWCERIMPLPDFIVEAELLHASQQVRATGTTDDATHEFLAHIVNTTAFMGDAEARPLRLRYVDALDMLLLTHDGQADAQADFPAVVLEPVARRAWEMQNKMASALAQGDLSTDLRRAQAAYDSAQADYQKWHRSVEVYAAQLASSGREKRLIELYISLTRRIGHEKAEKMFVSSPSLVHPLRTGWQHNASVKLQKSGKVLREQDLLSEFCKCVKRTLKHEDIAREAKGELDEARQSYREWRGWLRSSKTQDFVRLSAQVRLVYEVLGHIWEVQPGAPNGTMVSATAISRPALK